MNHPIRLLIICSWGATSSVLCQKINQAAQERGIPLVADAAGTGEFPDKLPLCDVILIEPQIGHHKHELQKAADARSIPCTMVDPIAFATMNGAKVLEQALTLIQQASTS